jgi:hypothetical protein
LKSSNTSGTSAELFLTVPVVKLVYGEHLEEPVIIIIPSGTVCYRGDIGLEVKIILNFE